MRLHNASHFALGGLILSALLTPVAARAEQPPVVPVMERTTQPAIVASGSGEVNIVPNIAYLNLGVETRDADSAKASTLNAGKMEQVMKAVRAFGIADRDIQTVGYSIYQMNEPGPNGKPGRNFFVVNNSVRVTIRKFNDVGKIIDGTTQLGANAVGGIQLDADDETKERAYDEALEKAVASAARKAKTMARAGGVNLDRLIELSESGPEMPVPMAKGAMRFSEAATPISGGELVIRANVTARYSIIGNSSVR